MPISFPPSPMPMVVTAGAARSRVAVLEQPVQRGASIRRSARRGSCGSGLDVRAGTAARKSAQRRRAGTRLADQRLLVVARSDAFNGDDVRRASGPAVFEEGVNPALGRRLAVDADGGGGADGNRKRVTAGCRHGRPQGRRAQSVGHERRWGCRCDSSARASTNRAGRTVGFGGRRLGGGDEKAGDNGGVPARCGQRLAAACARWPGQRGP